jgi:hypothetical protein
MSEEKPVEVDLTKTETPVTAEAGFDDKGDFRVGHRIDAEHYETLKVLMNSPGWKLYRQILINTKEAFSGAIMAMSDPNSMVKTVGMMAGLNMSINQLPVLCADYDKAMKKALEKAEKKEVPFKRG